MAAPLTTYSPRVVPRLVRVLAVLPCLPLLASCSGKPDGSPNEPIDPWRREEGPVRDGLG